ncbi:hypothetical protein EXU85_01010 [Spirosoma sp. KCTC 42546]|uniref:beta strand repeat-containing protein n=1 Tax=Spirosoma sp. KCTC 42546 TaxID=2520506 RepID=UPI0011591C8C|nr:putative Ig domain-containing protein [Spirosoma sp. KCTC 42546]QDK77247.1 hypothetical protein EXU85_01010 [Spirosoma sp. KCTC 42546]
MTRAIPGIKQIGQLLFSRIAPVIGGGLLFIQQGFAQYTPGNLVVLQAGTGTGSLVNTGNPIVLREFTPTGTASTTVTVSSSGGDALIISGSAASEGLLARSPDGRLLVFGGYAQTLPNSTQLANSTSATINRAIGTVDPAGTFSRVAVSNTFHSANNIRGAASDGLTNFWSAGGNDGTDYFGTGTVATVQNAKVNTRAVAVFNSKLYFSTQSSAGTSTSLGIYQVGSGLPTTAGQPISLIIDTGTGSNAAGFYFNPAGTICYIADGRTVANGGGIQKWTFNGSIWSLAYTFGTGAASTNGAFGVAVDFSGASPVIYATTTESTANRLIKVTDTGSDATVSLVTTAPANTSFRGVAFAPVTPQPDLTITLAAPAAGIVNQPFDYSVVVSNPGSASASGISAQVTLPASGATYITAVGASGFTANESGGIVTFSNGTLSAGGSTTLTVSVTPTVTGTLVSGIAQVDPLNTVSESNEVNNSAQSVTTTVGAGNQPPTAPVLVNQVGNVGVPFTYTIPAFTDPESQSLTYVITGAPGDLTVDNATRLISGTPTTTGISTVTVVVTDPGSLSATGTFTITINTNQPPVAPSIANQTATVGTAFSFTVPAFTDPESQSLTYAISGVGNGLSANNNTRIINGTPTASSVQMVTVVASDPTGQTATATFSLSVSATPAGLIQITEYMYASINEGGSGVGEFVELTNVGNAPIDLTGWSFDDNSRQPGSFTGVSAFGVVQPNESVIITDATAEQFRSFWFLPASVKVVGENSQNLGRSDEINIYDASTNLVARLTFNDQGANPSGTVRTQFVSAWPQRNLLGQTNTGGWQLSVVNDSQDSYMATTGDVGNPGGYFIPLNRSVSIHATTNSAYLNLSSSGPAFVSGVLNDPTDPASTIGLNFTLSAATNLTVTASSSNASVVTDANLNLTGTGASRNLKITPNGIGYTTITLTVSSSTASGSYVLNYAASAASTTPALTRFHTGASDASTAIRVDADYMLVGDSENQVLRLYNRQNSGLPLAGFDYSSSLNLTDLAGAVPREVALEASAIAGNRIYWFGSQSNKAGGGARPNRDRVYATDVTLNGANTTLAYVSRYDYLREDIIAWDVNNSHGKGANYYGLQASADAATDPKASSGYNIEGAEFAPDGSTVYIGFRAPQVPLPGRPKALIIPITNLAGILASTGGTLGSATFGAPIELDLGGRGIREIRKNAANQYLIIAGSSGGASNTPPDDFRLYTWTGAATDAPVLRADNLATLAVDGSFEAIVEVPSDLTVTSQIQLLVDNGDAVYYNDATIAKDLPQANFKKFRSEVITLGTAQQHDLSPTVDLPQANFDVSGPDATRNFIVTIGEVGGLATTAGTIVITMTAPAGYTVSFDNTLTSINVTDGSNNPVTVANTKWTVTSNVADRQLSLRINSGQLIGAGGQAVLGFSITRTTANSGSVSNIIVNVQDDGANNYDSNSANNVYSRIVTGL